MAQAFPFAQPTDAGPVDVTCVTGTARQALVPDIAALRIGVFREWPYLYEGDLAYEAEYLQTYLRSPLAAIIVARQDMRVVGASTCIPLVDETADVQAPFRARAWDPTRFCYFGESLLLPDLRGRGIGVRFFAEREAHARASDADFTCFCAVLRPDDHPRRPPAYQKLDGFWTRRGYTRRPDLTCTMTWLDAGEAAPTPKTLVFWLKSLHGAPLP